MERGNGLMGGDSGGAIRTPRVLASGPVATVYAGVLAGTEVAVKVFAERLDRDTVARLDRERQALASVRSRGAILPIDGLVDLPDGRTGVRMELCPMSLGTALAGGTPTVADVLGIGLAVAGALAAAHGAGVVHGGVTPENVLYRRNGEFAVSDFGLALRERFPRDPTHALEYTSPETLSDDTRSVASDLYGLGAVLYAALTGAPPFPRRTGEQPGERILRVLREEVPPVRGEGVPTELSDVVGRLLAKDPAARPPDAATVAAVFGRLLGIPTATPDAPTEVPQAPEDDFDFDDFAPGPRRPWSEEAPTQPIPVIRPGRTLIHSTDKPAPRTKSKRRRVVAIAGAGAVLAGLAVTPFLIGGSSPPQAEPPISTEAQPQEPFAQTPTTTPKVNLVLDPPADKGDHVDLSWRADGDLDFAVIVAGDHIDTMTLFANRQRTMRVPVDPARKYCFQIRATDARHIYTTEPMPIRDARCTQ